MVAPVNITVYTWPYQWVYEPVYWAFSALEATGKWRFWYKHAFEEDEKIFAAFSRDRSGLAIALCQPPRDPKPYRLIPVLWRVPIWGLVSTEDAARYDLSNESLVYPEGNKQHLERFLRSEFSLALFRAGATVGRMSRDFLKRVVANLQIYVDLDRETEEYGDQLESALMGFSTGNSGASTPPRATRIAFTYSPLHSVSDNCVAVCKLSGGAKLETAVIFNDNLKDQANRKLRHDLLDLIKFNIGSLYGAIDVFDDTLEIVRGQDEVTSAMDSDDRRSVPVAKPWYSNPRTRASLLAVYLHHGCFFPYGIVDTSMGADTWSMLRETILENTESMQDTFLSKLTTYSSWQFDWSGTKGGATDRLQLLTHRPTSAPDPNYDLATSLLHLYGSPSAVEACFRKMTLNHDDFPRVPLHAIDAWEDSRNTTRRRYVCNGLHRSTDNLSDKCGFTIGGREPASRTTKKP